MSVDLPNEFYNGIKLQLKVDQWVMRSALSGQKKNPRLTYFTGKFQNKLLKVFCWTVRIDKLKFGLQNKQLNIKKLNLTIWKKAAQNTKQTENFSIDATYNRDWCVPILFLVYCEQLAFTFG